MPISDAYQADAYATFTNIIDATQDTSTTVAVSSPSTDPYTEFLAQIDS
jgi:hypothetical protein